MNTEKLQRKSITKYTKHYYIGTERIASTLGTMKNLGLLCENNWPGNNDLVNEMGTKTIDAGSVLIADYDTFEKELQLSEPFIYETYLPCEGRYHEPINYDAYWYHPDHLGSSNYITNLDGDVSQHMEYFPFGETLVEEHLNSYNSPYKFNAKEYDAETGWYYYGARYYNPKWSIWLGVDPLSEMYPSLSSYIYVANNPINFVDPDGRRIKGATKKDVNKYITYLNNVLKDSRFDDFRELIIRKGKSIGEIDEKAFNTYLKNNASNLSEDDIQYLNTLVGAINSEDVMNVTYKKATDVVSGKFKKAFDKNIPEYIKGKGRYDENGNLKLDYLAKQYGGVTTEYNGDTYSIIFPRIDRSDTHETIGHGYYLLNGFDSEEEQHRIPIQWHNMEERVKGTHQYRDGTNHGNKSCITNDQSRPEQL